MKEYVFDVETDGLLDDCTKEFCIVIYDINEEKFHCFHGEELLDGLFFLKNSDRLIGHNIVSFDIPVLKKIFKWEPSANTEIVDTLVMSKLIYPDRAVRDAKNNTIDKDMYGRHSLKCFC